MTTSKFISNFLQNNKQNNFESFSIPLSNSYSAFNSVNQQNNKFISSNNQTTSSTNNTNIQQRLFQNTQNENKINDDYAFKNIYQSIPQDNNNLNQNWVI